MRKGGATQAAMGVAIWGLCGVGMGVRWPQLSYIAALHCDFCRGSRGIFWMIQPKFSGIPETRGLRWSFCLQLVACTGAGSLVIYQLTPEEELL